MIMKLFTNLIDGELIEVDAKHILGKTKTPDVLYSDITNSYSYTNYYYIELKCKSCKYQWRIEKKIYPFFELCPQCSKVIVVNG